METIWEGRDMVWSSSSRLPYSLHGRAGEGSTSEVYKATVETGHFQYQGKDNSNLKPQIMAVKLFNAISSYDFENEKAVLSHIRRGNVHKNVLINYGSLVHPEERSSNLVRALLLPWTDFGTLENLMKDNRNRDTPTKRRNNIHGMVGVADALAWLSQMKISLPRIPTRKVQVMHCDIKPQNILVFPAPDQEDRFIFKVSDFGHAFLSMSIRRPSPRYESTYCAPEIAWGNRIVEKNSDVWPFGCVLLLVLIFTTRGYQEITILRENLQDNGTYDTFYESTAEPTRYRLKRPVSNWIENLRKGALSTEDINETEMTKETGKILHEYILVPDYKSRKDMAFICEKLEAAYSTVHTALETNSFSDYPGLDQYTLCTIPTKAEYICFHSNNMNRCGVFFIDTLLFQGRLPIIRPMIHQPETIWARRFSLTVSTCTSSDICLVRDASQYNLVAQLDQICLYRLYRDQGAGFTALRSYEIPWARLGNTVKLAISPDGEWIAISTTIENKYRIHITPIRNLREASRRASGETTTALTNVSSNSSHSTQSNSSRLESLFEQELKEAVKVREIRFTRNSESLIVVTELYHKPPKQVIKVWYFQCTNLRWVLKDRWRCQDDGSVHTNEFWTSIAPFNHSPGFLAITHNRKIIRSGAAGFSSEVRDWSKYSSKLEKVLLTEDDSFGIILGIDRGLKVYVVSTTDMDKTTEILYRETSRDPSRRSYQNFSAGLYNEDGKLHLIVGLPVECSIIRLDITEAVLRFRDDIL